jgi:hypothetical protein
MKEPVVKNVWVLLAIVAMFTPCQNPAWPEELEMPGAPVNPIAQADPIFRFADIYNALINRAGSISRDGYPDITDPGWFDAAGMGRITICP